MKLNHIAPPNWYTLCGRDIQDPEVLAWDFCSLPADPEELHNATRWCPECVKELEITHVNPQPSTTCVLPIDPSLWKPIFEVTIWWDYECHGQGVWGQQTNQYTKEELAQLLSDRHLVCIQVEGGPAMYCRGASWYQGIRAPDYTGSTNTECAKCLELSADRDPWEGFVNNEGDLNWEE